ncbi:MAG: RimK family protein [Nitrospirota bacterium]|nr:MAG: RimK family protein [Nitrospirota bacterium]
MKTIIVVNNLSDWPLQVEGLDIVTARKYLTDPAYAETSNVKVYNLSRSHRYQGIGYYVSLLAEARGHKPLPSINTIQDLKSKAAIQVASEELEREIQNSLSSIQSNEFVLSIYFGRNVAKRHDRLSQKIFKFFPAPFLKATFSRMRKNGQWYIRNIQPSSASDIIESHRQFAIDVAQEFFNKKRVHIRKRRPFRYDLAILHNPSEEEPPSNPGALKKFVRAAESLGMATELIEKADYHRLGEFDALFIRETTKVNHHTFRFARKAAAEGLVVIDDPLSILKCTNKVFLAELLERKKIKIPRTVIVHRENLIMAGHALGYPCILKSPDSSFSQGVIKVDSEDDFLQTAKRMLESSELVIAQEYMETLYDWRVGVFDRTALYVCKYYMAHQHWQIIKRDVSGLKTGEGGSEAISMEKAPQGLIKTALRAANLIGSGFYGVDIKEVGNRFYVIEINDNPSIDAGFEDELLKGSLYTDIMNVFVQRLDKTKER